MLLNAQAAETTSSHDPRVAVRTAMPLPIIVNPAAGLGRSPQEIRELESIFADAGVAAKVLVLDAGADVTSVAAEAARAKPAAVIAGGGDGTINAVASALAGTDVALGVLPMGTLNHFAKDLGIPLDVAEAARTIAAGHTSRVDGGEVNGRIFINNSSLGLYPSIVRHRESQQRRLGRGKWPALLWATLTVLHRNPLLTVRVSLDNEQHQCTTGFVFIGNNEYIMEGFNVGARARLDGGRLSLYMTRRRSRTRLFTLAFRALIGRLYQARDFEALTAKSITIESRHSHLHVATDGEVAVLQTPLEYAIRPGALKVLTPAPHEEEA